MFEKEEKKPHPSSSPTPLAFLYPSSCRGVGVSELQNSFFCWGNPRCEGLCIHVVPQRRNAFFYVSAL